MIQKRVFYDKYFHFILHYASQAYKIFRMELRVLRYFLAVANEGSVSRAAAALHVTQPTLSRQLMDLEDELGTKLFRRSSRSTTLTESGVYFRRRAEEIVALADAAQAEFRGQDDVISGDIAIGGGESPGFALLAEAAQRVQSAHPGVHFRLYSGNGNDVTERLERGVLDFALCIAPIDLSRYHTLELSARDTWGVLMPADSPLAASDSIRPEQLRDKPLIISSQSRVDTMLSEWFGEDIQRLRIAARGNLLYNISHLVRQGMGYAVTLDGIINTAGDSGLTFRPLNPPLEATLTLAWLKSRPVSRAAAVWLRTLRALIAKN